MMFGEYLPTIVTFKQNKVKWVEAANVWLFISIDSISDEAPWNQHVGGNS